MLEEKKIRSIGRYSVIPLALAVILFVISAFSLGTSIERSNDAATVGYYLLAIGAIMKFIPYIGRRKEMESDNSVR